MKLEMDSASLLSEPQDNYTPESIERDVHQFTIKLDADKSSVRQYSRQYAHSYSVRLWGMRPILEEKVKTLWNNIELKKIADLCESSGSGQTSNQNTGPANMNDSGEDHHGQNIAFHEDIIVAVIGTIFKQQPEKPSILQDLREENPMIPVEQKKKFISDNDIILVEDETTRARIIPTEGCGLDIKSIVNGVICALKGRPNVNGKFEVLETIYATPSVAKPLSSSVISDVEMIFVSGLEMGSNYKQLVQLDLLMDYLEGLGGSPEEQKCSLKKKSQVYFLGDCFAPNETKDENDQKNLTSQNEIGYKLDKMFDQLSKTMEVFVIPGFNDPTSKMLPQPKLHQCIFPKASVRPTFHSLSNPTRVSVSISNNSQVNHRKGESDILDILLTSGENIKDAMRNCDVECPLEMSQKILEWGHLCPTAPDTLALQPGVPEDIFIVQSLPNIFIAGNQERFGMKVWNGTTIVSVPKFSETFEVAVMTDSMSVVPLSFKFL